MIPIYKTLEEYNHNYTIEHFSEYFPYTILLTCCVYINKKKDYLAQVNYKERIHTYLKSIRNWLEKTNLPIVIIDNSGYTFPEINRELYKNRLEIISFREEKKKKFKKYYNSGSKGWSEGNAIQYAFRNSKILKNTDFIIKITGRYFIPDFESYVNQFNPNDYQVFGQNDKDRCEMVGTHKKYFFHIFSVDYKNEKGELDEHVENVYKFRLDQYPQKIPSRKFSIESTPQGGHNHIITEL